MIDANLVFDTITGVALTASRDSTNILDMLALRDVGAGNDLELHVFVQTTLASAGGTATLQIALQTADTVGGTYYDLIKTPVYAEADLVAGTGLLRYVWPVFQLNKKTNPGQFYKLRYTVAVENFTSGKVGAYVAGEKDRNVYFTYPRNYAVL